MAGHLTDRRGPLVTLGLVLSAALVPLTALAPGRAHVYVLLACLGGAQSLVVNPTGPALAAAVERRGGGAYGAVSSLLNIAFAAGEVHTLAGGRVGFPSSARPRSGRTSSYARRLGRNWGTRQMIHYTQQRR
jgi:hypothetical protein